MFGRSRGTSPCVFSVFGVLNFMVWSITCMSEAADCTMEDRLIPPKKLADQSNQSIHASVCPSHPTYPCLTLAVS